MSHIDLTTKKGCFNCSRLKNCQFIKTEKDKGRDFSEVLDDQEEPYVYGCACSDYDTKIRVQFT